MEYGIRINNARKQEAFFFDIIFCENPTTVFKYLYRQPMDETNHDNHVMIQQHVAYFSRTSNNTK